MSPDVSLKINTPIQTICLLDPEEIEKAARGKAEAQALQQAHERLAGVCAALENAAGQLEQLRSSLVSSHREQIVRLSLDIAGKIIGKEVAEGNYAIETIVLEALQAAPSAKQMTVRLNPDDLKAFETVATEGGLRLPPNTEWVADWAVNPAECVIDTEAGSAESLIEEHLHQIGEALLHTSQAS